MGSLMRVQAQTVLARLTGAERGSVSWALHGVLANTDPGDCRQVAFADAIRDAVQAWWNCHPMNS